MLKLYPCETYLRNNYRFCPDCGVEMGPDNCPIKDSELWVQVEDESLTLGAMLEAYSEVSGSSLVPCPSCQFQNEPDALFCGNCGVNLQQGAPAAPGPTEAAPAVAPPAPAPAAGGGPTCATCGAQNEPGAAFCEMCGGTLSGGAPATGGTQVSCQACGAQNEPGSAFCEMCGAALGGGAPAAAPAAPARKPVCNACGAENEAGAAFCEMCGASLQEAATAQTSLPEDVVALPDPNAEVTFDLDTTSTAPMEDLSFEEDGGFVGEAGPTCGVCGHGNEEGAGFCEMCGSQLN